jgi:hypothetical protein
MRIFSGKIKRLPAGPVVGDAVQRTRQGIAISAFILGFRFSTGQEETACAPSWSS